MAKIIEKMLHVTISQWLLVAMIAGGGVILGIAGWRLLNPTPPLNAAESAVIVAVLGGGGLVYMLYERLNR